MAPGGCRPSGSPRCPAACPPIGRTIVLVDAAADRRLGRGHGDPLRAILDRSFLAEPRIVTLAGSFEYDALSPDGSRLYVAEHIAGPLRDRYQIRVVDTATGFMGREIIVDKRNIDEVMAGRPIDQATTDAGVVDDALSRRRVPVHPRAAQRRGVGRLHRSARRVASRTMPPATDWGVALLPAVRARWRSTRPWASLPRSTRPTSPCGARSTSSRRHRPRSPSPSSATRRSGTVDRRIVASPTGDAVYAAGPGGIVRLATDDLTVTGRWLAGEAVDALALTPDGTRPVRPASTPVAGSPDSTRRRARSWAGSPARATTGWSAITPW